MVELFYEQINLKNEILLHFVQTYQKGKRFDVWTCHVTRTEKGNNLPLWKCHVTMTKKDASIVDKLQLQNPALMFNHKNKSLLSATSILSLPPMAYNTTASLDKLTCTN